MRGGDAKPRRAARKRTVAEQQGARELSSRAFTAKRRPRTRGKCAALSAERRADELLELRERVLRLDPPHGAAAGTHHDRVGDRASGCVLHTA